MSPYLPPYGSYWDRYSSAPWYQSHGDWSEIVDGCGHPTGIAIGTPAAARYEEGSLVIRANGQALMRARTELAMFSCTRRLADQLEHAASACTASTGTGHACALLNCGGTLAKVLAPADDAVPSLHSQFSLGIPAGGKRAGSARALALALPAALAFGENALVSIAHLNFCGALSGNLIASMLTAVVQQVANVPVTDVASTTRLPPRLLCYCDETEERSLAVVMALLAHCFSVHETAASGPGA
jgi:hypothetical protein